MELGRARIFIQVEAVSQTIVTTTNRPFSPFFEVVSVITHRGGLARES